MKIVLRAFNNKLNGVMEVPEETGKEFSLAMSQPIQAYSIFGSKNNADLMKSPISTICTFQWTGNTFLGGSIEHEFDGAREYQLVKIEVVSTK